MLLFHNYSKKLLIAGGHGTGSVLDHENIPMINKYFYGSSVLLTACSTLLFFTIKFKDRGSGRDYGHYHIPAVRRASSFVAPSQQQSS